MNCCSTKKHTPPHKQPHKQHSTCLGKVASSERVCSLLPSPSRPGPRTRRVVAPKTRSDPRILAHATLRSKHPAATLRGAEPGPPRAATTNPREERRGNATARAQRARRSDAVVAPWQRAFQRCCSACGSGLAARVAAAWQRRGQLTRGGTRPAEGRRDARPSRRCGCS
eukprot:925011-Prymnesium_polylepis.2